jgi:hypothetical protein
MKTKESNLTGIIIIGELSRISEIIRMLENPIQPDIDEKKQARQFMGEVFLSWADEYFSDESHRNERIKRGDLYENFIEHAPEQCKYTPQSKFKVNIRKYCEFRDYLFNPHRYLTSKCGAGFVTINEELNFSIDDKEAGVEYFMVGDKNVWLKNESYEAQMD